MIFIGYDYNGKVITIVNAVSKQIANAYWQGADISVHSSKCLEEDFTKLENHPTGVFPLMKTVEVDDYKLLGECRMPKGRKFILIE